MRRLPVIAMITALSAVIAFSQIPRKLSYQGLLTDSLGTPKPDNLYDLTFRLYRTASGGTPLWTDRGPIPVKRGLFSVVLGDHTPLPDSLKFDTQYWLGIQVSVDAELTPRLPLTAAGYSLRSVNADTAKYAKAAPQAAFVDSARIAGTLRVPFVLAGTTDVWPIMRAVNDGSAGAILGYNGGTGRGGVFQISNVGNASTALEGITDGSGIGVHGSNTGTGKGGLFQIQNAANASPALEGVTDGTGRAAWFHIENSANTDHAVEATTNSNFGGSALYGNASTTTGYADGVTGMAHAYSSVGGRFSNDGTGTALMADGVGDGADRATMKVHNNSPNYGMAAKITNLSGYHTMHIQNTGSGGILYLQNNGDANGTGGNDFISALSSTLDAQFRVLSSGEVRSDVGFNTPAADFAEMLPAADGLEPADVLVIGEDGTLILSSRPYQSNVAGVYSTKPGFTGGTPVEGQIAGTIPLAISGIVPAKVTDENGPIMPGDLLVTSSTPGYAMKADRNPIQGSVIGKALQRLEQGKGRIRILAILQ